MSTIDTYPDIEGASRTYLRAHATMQPLIGQRVFFGIPDSPTFPLVTIKRVGGIEDGSNAPLDQAYVQFDVWGGFTANGQHGNKAEATAVMLGLRAVLNDLTTRGGTYLDAHTYCYGAPLIGAPLWTPDPNNSQPRYVLTAQMPSRAA